MTNIKIQPFDAETISRIRTALRDLHDFLPELDRVERCGIDCAPMRAELDRKKERLQNMLAEFGGGQ